MATMKEYRHSKDNPYHISSGGVVYRVRDGKIEVVVLSRNEPDGKHYHLPKGTLHHNETLEDCAVREVEEESGALGKIVDYLGAITDKYTSPRDNLQVDKTTHYFAMEFVEEGGLHDAEHDNVYWKEINEAKNLLQQTEPDKKEYIIVCRALDKLNRLC